MDNFLGSVTYKTGRRTQTVVSGNFFLFNIMGQEKCEQPIAACVSTGREAEEKEHLSHRSRYCIQRRRDAPGDIVHRQIFRAEKS